MQVEQKSRDACARDGDVESGVEAARLAGAFERYRLAIPELQGVQMLPGQGAFSRAGPLTAWVVIWLMIFQRLDAGATRSAAVRERLPGGVRAFVRWPVESLSANTSAYSQARTKLPVALIEKVSDMIFDSLQAQLRSLAGLERPMFLLDGTSIQLQHSKELLEKWPPARNQHGSSHWSVIRVVVT